MIRLWSCLVLVLASTPVLAAKSCEELKVELADKLAIKGVSGFQLEIVASDSVDARSVIGSCAGGSMKILYSRGLAVASAVPQASAAAPRASKQTPDSSRPMAKRKSGPVRGQFRDPLSEGGEGPTMVVIPAGEFVMGSTRQGVDRYRETPEHKVSVRSFAMARTEITFEDFDRFATATRRRLPADDGQGRGTRPVVDVSWEDATAYVEWLSVQTGFAYRLPSEAEWEYAARAGGKAGAAYGTGDCIAARQANFNDAVSSAFNNCPASNVSLGKAQPVASYPPNRFGLHDMHGNVFEWTADCMHLSYEHAPLDGSAWVQGGNCGERMVRGGSWQSGQISLRSALRAAIGFADSSPLIGFRVARTLGPSLSVAPAH